MTMGPPPKWGRRKGISSHAAWELITPWQVQSELQGGVCGVALCGDTNAHKRTPRHGRKLEGTVATDSGHFLAVALGREIFTSRISASARLEMDKRAPTVFYEDNDSRGREGRTQGTGPHVEEGSLQPGSCRRGAAWTPWGHTLSQT